MVANEDKSKILIELDTYLCEEGREPNLIFTKKHLYPCLYKLALKYLSILATSAPIEKVFSQWFHYAATSSIINCKKMFAYSLF